MIRKIITFILILIFCLAATTFGEVVDDELAHAAKGLNIFMIVVDTLTLLFLFCAAIFGLRLYHFMRGGEMSFTWRWLIGASVLFVIGKVVELAHLAGDLPSYDWLLRIIYMLVSLFLAMGFFRQKKILT